MRTPRPLESTYRIWHVNDERTGFVLANGITKLKSRLGIQDSLKHDDFFVRASTITNLQPEFFANHNSVECINYERARGATAKCDGGSPNIGSDYLTQQGHGGRVAAVNSSFLQRRFREGQQRGDFSDPSPLGVWAIKLRTPLQVEYGVMTTEEKAVQRKKRIANLYFDFTDATRANLETLSTPRTDGPLNQVSSLTRKYLRDTCTAHNWDRVSRQSSGV